MKKIISASLLLTILLFALNACSASEKKKPHLNLPFEVQVATLSQREDVEQNYQNEFFFFQNVKDLEKGRESLSKYFILDEEIGGTTADKLFYTYDSAFFETHTLLLFKRLHSTDTTLDLTRIDVENGACTVHANMFSGEPPISSFRLYFVTLDKADFLRNDLNFSLDIEEVEKNVEEIYKTKLVVALGSQYKVVEDDVFAKELESRVLDYPLEPLAKDPDSFPEDTSALVLLGPKFYVRITKNYIDIMGGIYAPNEELFNSVLQTYVALETEEKSLTISQEETN